MRFIHGIVLIEGFEERKPMLTGRVAAMTDVIHAAGWKNVPI